MLCTLNGAMIGLPLQKCLAKTLGQSVSNPNLGLNEVPSDMVVSSQAARRSLLEAQPQTSGKAVMKQTNIRVMSFCLV